MSLQNPTWSFLQTLKKPVLQKHCQKLGLNGIWVTKEELIKSIIENHQRSSTVGEETEEVLQADDSNLSLQKILSEVREIKEKLAIKDVEVDDLYEKLRIASNTISNLEEKISSLEDQARRGLGQANANDPSPPTRTTLLLGDTNLSYIASSDLGQGCTIRTIKEANIDLMKSWITDKLDWIPARCILYGGIADILENTNPSKILDSIGMLISDLKTKNPDMDIYICQLVPTLQSDELQAKINEFNDELLNWSLTNEISVLCTNLPFKLATNEVDEMCFNMNDENPGLFLNRLGVIRLLDYIAKKCSNFNLSENWTKIKRSQDSSFKQSNKRYDHIINRPNIIFNARISSDRVERRERIENDRSNYNNDRYWRSRMCSFYSKH